MHRIITNELFIATHTVTGTSQMKMTLILLRLLLFMRFSKSFNVDDVLHLKEKKRKIYILFAFN